MFSMWASSWALNDFLQCGSFEAASCHAMEHELSAFYDITHGLGLAILIPRWMEYVLDDSNAAQFKTFGVNVLGLDASLPERKGAKKAIQRLFDFFFRDLGLQSTLTEFGIGRENFKAMAEKACKGDTVKGFRELIPADVEKILEMCL